MGRIERLQQTEVWYAKTNTDGTLGSWTATTPLTSARAQIGTAVYNGFLYVVGGQGSAQISRDVQYCIINADGSLGAWQTATSLPTARFAGQAVAVNGKLYFIGGNDGTTYPTDIQIATIALDGSIGSWQSGPAIASGRYMLTVRAYQDYIYLLGGSNGSTHYLDIESLKVK